MINLGFGGGFVVGVDAGLRLGVAVVLLWVWAGSFPDF